MMEEPTSPVIHEAYARWDRTGWAGMPERDAPVVHRLRFPDWNLEMEVQVFPYRMKRQTWDTWRVWFGICPEGPSSRAGHVLDDEPDRFWKSGIPFGGAVLELQVSINEPEDDQLWDTLKHVVAHTLYVVGQTPDDIALISRPHAEHLLPLQKMGFRPLMGDDSASGLWRRLGDRPLAWPDIVPPGLGFSPKDSSGE